LPLSPLPRCLSLRLAAAIDYAAAITPLTPITSADISLIFAIFALCYGISREIFAMMPP
jgi:hypothetical protein